MSNGLLIVDDELGARQRVGRRGDKLGFRVLEARTVKDAFDLWKENKIAISAVVLDLNIEKEGDGWTLLETFRKDGGGLDDFEVLIYSANFRDIRAPLEAIRTQTVSLYRKNDDEDQLWKKLETLAKRFLKPPAAFHFTDEEKVEMDTIANSCFPLLIIGTPGSGKTVKARELARRSLCAKDRTFLINCASLSRELADEELFGSTRGSYTSSVANRVGIMMAASGFSPNDLSRTDKAADESPKGFKAYKSDKKQWGAVILDEIGSLDLIVQAKLLLVIEGEPMHPVGWTSDGFLPNFRIIAATNQIRDLRTPTLFRPDLLKRLSTYVMQCKDLADEPNEKIREIISSVSIPIRLNGRPSPSISPQFSKEALDQLIAMKGEIKGGYRELHSIIERAWLNSKKLHRTGQEVEITPEDIQRGREFSVEVYSQFDENDSSVERDVYVSSDAEVKELKIKIAHALSVDLVDLNHISFRNAVAQSSNTELLKKELKLVLGIDGVPASKKKSIFTALGLALDYKPREKKVQPGTKEYARVMSNYFSKQFGQTPSKTSEDLAE